MLRGLLKAPVSACAEPPHRAETERPLAVDRASKPSAEQARVAGHDSGEHGMAISPNEIQAIKGVRTMLRPLLIEDYVDERDETSRQSVECPRTRCQGEERLMS